VPEPGRVLGLDPGDARIGVAISDPDRRVAVPFGTVQVGQPPGELQAVAAIVSEHDIGVVVIGLPRELSGKEGPRASHARAFASAIGAFAGVEVEFQDERLTTVEAERMLRSVGVVGRQRRRAVDQTAATVILQAWIDRQHRT
jgi:putative pre-16S rRNA nuclease